MSIRSKTVSFFWNYSIAFSFRLLFFPHHHGGDDADEPRIVLEEPVHIVRLSHRDHDAHGETFDQHRSSLPTECSRRRAAICGVSGGASADPTT